MPRKKPTRKGTREAFDAGTPAPDAAFRTFRPEKKPLTARHLAYMQSIRDKQIVLAVSPAGCGKTSLACQVAVELLRRGAVGKLVVARIQSVDGITRTLTCPVVHL